MDTGGSDYPYIRMWGRRLGSHTGYIAHEIAQARRDGAPATAFHRRLDGTWKTVDEITNTELRVAFGLPPLLPTPPTPRQRVESEREYWRRRHGHLGEAAAHGVAVDPFALYRANTAVLVLGWVLAVLDGEVPNHPQYDALTHAHDIPRGPLVRGS